MLIFISNSLMTKELYEQANVLDMYPITLGIASGKMYRMQQDTITVDNSSRRWGGNNIFGMVFHINDDKYFLRKLDAYYGCSLSALLRNHARDLNHRKLIKVIPISPESLEDLASHRYSLNEPIECWAWMANENNQRVRVRTKYDKNRVRPGCNVEAVKKAFQLLK